MWREAKCVTAYVTELVLYQASSNPNSFVNPKEAPTCLGPFAIYVSLIAIGQ
jgi:hypothetical protein